MTTDIALELDLAVTADRAYDALRSTAQVARWFASDCDVDVAAGRFAAWGTALRGAPARPGTIRLAAVRPGRGIDLDWTLDGVATRVELDVRPEPDGCVVSVHHTGVPELDEGEAGLDDFWLLALENLRGHLERGAAPLFHDHTHCSGPARLRVHVAAPPDAVDRALIEPAALDRWIATRATVEARPGGAYDFGWRAGPAGVVAYEPSRRLRIAWRYRGDTVVTWTLDGDADGTWLTLAHEGWDEERITADHQMGWTMYAARLRGLVETGARWRRPRVVARAAAD